MTQVCIIPATADHIREVTKMVRPADRAELWASSMTTPEAAIKVGFENSDCTMVGLADGVPVCVWGVVHESIIGNIGTPWMVATTALEKYARLFIKHCRDEAMKTFAGYDVLENYVHAKNTKAIQWLKFLGFSVSEEPEEYGMLGELFYRFELRRA